MKRLPFLYSFLLSSSLCLASVNVGSLTTDNLARPLNIESQHPTLSWIITSPEHGVMQTSYHILVASSPELLTPGKADVWDTGTVKSDQSVRVPYEGKRLKSNSRYYWKVKVATTRGESAWSEPAEWGTGPIGESAWGGQWIGWDAPFEWDVEDSHSRMSARYLRTEFNTQPKEIKKATAHISGLGLHELYINGKKAGDEVLAPAPTDYRRTVLYNSHDVTDLLRGDGKANAIGVALGNGRYYTMRQNYKPYKINTFGYPKMRMNLVIEYTDGSVQKINSDTKWDLTARGPIRSNNEYDGEIYDASMELGDWTLPGYDAKGWIKADRVSIPYGTLRGNKAEGMKVMQTIKPKSIRKTADGYLVDFGQNTAGWVNININGTAKGDSVKIRYAERLTPDSLNIDVENFRHAQSTDIYVANGKERNTKWSPKFSYHGFQFAEVSGLPKLGTEDIVAEVVYDNMDNNGTFSCSDNIINSIHRNAWWGVTSNYKGVPVDCPQRDERQPWTGDHVMGSWGENFMLDNANFYAKWMDDMREAQREDGCIPDICPPYYNYFTSDMTWSSALPVVCDMLYQQTGNPEPIIKNYEAMKKWLNHITDGYTDKDGIITADKYGDWCVPPEKPELIHSQDPARKTDGALIASAYYCKIARMMADFAEIAGHPEEAAMWLKRSEEMKDAFNKKFLTVKRGTSLAGKKHILYPDSIFYGNNTVTSNILPLAFDMVPEDLKQDVRDNVIKTIITDNNGMISCGVIGVNWLMRELSRMGRGDVAMLLASNSKYPSWGYMIEKGATTIWELWNGDTASRKMNSCNHVMMLGDLISWFYRDLAGINPLKPGYKEILLKPDFSIPDLFNADGSYKTPYGTVSSSWRKKAGHLHWNFTIPCNTTATVVVPSANHKVIKVKGAKLIKTEGNNSYWEFPSGTYDLDITLDPSVGENRKGILTDEFLYETASFPQCHASSIIQLKNGDLLATYFGGSYEGCPDVCIWVSRKPKGSDVWSEPILAADGVFDLSDPLCKIGGLSGIVPETTPASKGPIGPNFKGNVENARRKACYNPVLFQIPGSDEILLFFKIGAKVADWTGWLTRSTDGGKTWSDREPLPEGFLGPIKNKPEYIAGKIIAPSSREGSEGWNIWMEISDDNGKTWRTTGALPADSSYLTSDRLKMKETEYNPENPQIVEGKKPHHIYSIQPSILKHKDGSLQIICRTRNARLSTSWSYDNGETWTPLTLMDLPNNNSGTDAVTLPDGRHALIYNDFATIPGTPKGVRTPLCIAISEDGINWDNIITLEDSPISQYSYPSIIMGNDGLLHAIYTWRRLKVKHAAVKL